MAGMGIVRGQGWRRWVIALGLVVGGGLGVAPPAAGRTVEVHVTVRTDFQRIQPSGPSDEPLEPQPSLERRARDLVAQHPSLKGLTVRMPENATPPNPRVSADFVRLVEAGVDDVLVVTVSYVVRLDSFRANGVARLQGHVAVYSAVARRQVASRSLVVEATYPGTVSKEAVLQEELAARTRGEAVPVEHIELTLLDRSVKNRLAAELPTALDVYYPPALPTHSTKAAEESFERLARFVAEAPDRRQEAIQLHERYLERYPDSPNRAETDKRLAELRKPVADPRQKEEQDAAERKTLQVSRALSAAELTTAMEGMVGAVVEVRDFVLWQQDAQVWLRTRDQRQDFLVERVPATLWTLESDPPRLYVQVVGRRPMPGFLDARVPVLRWVGCPRGVCPYRF